HLRTSVELLRPSLTTAQEAGNLKYAAYSCDRLVTVLLAAGDPLGDVLREAELGLEFARKAKFGYIVDIIIGQLGFIRTLLGLTASLSSFNDSDFDEHRFEQHLQANPHPPFATCWYWIRKLQALYYAGDYASALEAASKAEPLLQTGPGHFEWAEYLFYGALARAAQYDSISSEEKVRYREALAGHHKQIVVWAENCPENFGNRAALVAAEIAKIEGHELDAESLYEKAIQSARDHGFVQNEAIAYEAAARFYSERGFETIAHAYLRNARDCYLRWGALGKVRQLDQRDLGLREEVAPSALSTTVSAPVEQLDVGTVVKASQAVSSEIELTKLIETLMRVSLEHAGAERGLLILLTDKEPWIAAEATTGRGNIEVTLRNSALTPTELSEPVFHTAMRTRDSVILDDASAQRPFSADEYVREKHARSVLCLPLVKQAKLVGALYLENNLAPRVFTSAKLAVLELLASQAAISLENVQLYDDLRRSEAYLSEAQRLSHTGTFGWRPSSGEIYWTEETYRIFGYDPASTPTLELLQLRVHPDDAGAFRQVAERASNVGQDFAHEYRLRMPDESVKHVNVVARAFRDEVGEVEFVGSVIDVSAIRLAERELHKTQTDLAHVMRVTSLGELTASIAHEVNQPLGAVLINAE